MIGNFAANLAEAFLAPRRSARRIIALRPDARDCVLMVILGFAIQSGAVALLDLLTPWGLRSGSLGMRAGELVLQIVLFVALAAGAYGIGRRFGGRGDRDAVFAVVAWHFLVTAFLAPLNVIGMTPVVHPDMQSMSGLFLLVPFSVGMSIWLFASYVAEAHGFARIGPVIMATVAGFVLLGFLTLAATSALLGPAG